MIMAKALPGVAGVRNDDGLNVTSQWIFVTPEMAQEYLEKQAQNRTLSKTHRDKLVRDILADAFTLSHQGIAFDEGSQLVDGQHRCEAIIEARHGCLMLVTRGLPTASQTNIDTGRKRSWGDIERMRGGSDHHMRAAIAAEMGRPKKHPSHEELNELSARHRDAIEFALLAIPGGGLKGTRKAAVLAVIAKAYYSECRERLKEFGWTIRTGETKDPVGDTAAIKLRNWLLIRGTKEDSDEIYPRTQTALMRFLARDGRPLTLNKKHKMEFFSDAGK